MPIPAAKGRQILVGARIWRKFLNPFTTVSVNLTLLAIVVSICQNELALPCGARLKNRIAKSAMSENMANSQNCPDEKFEKLYKTWANGGDSLETESKSHKIIAEFPQVQNVFSRIGTAEVATDPMGVNLSDTFIMFKERSDWPDPSKTWKDI